jgi:heme/copper-type cytochrome/quinol oxidase subunit 1
MQPDPWNSDTDRFSRLRASFWLLVFGIVVMGYLMAIGHPDWFVLRPVSTASAAMSQAADHPIAVHKDNS